jgi:hypothetical protein
MPSSIMKHLVQTHREYLARQNNPGGGLAGGQQQVAAPAAVQPEVAPAAQPALGRNTRALLNRSLSGYPDIGDCLRRLEASSTNRSYTRFIPALTDALGAETVGELLLMIYEDVDAAADGACDNITASEVLTQFVKQSEPVGPPRLLATLMVHAFEAAAKGFEAVEVGF